MQSSLIMQKSMYDPLMKLDKSRTTTWRIKVRVIRMWPTQNAEKTKFSGYNLILCDDDESLIHAFVYADKWAEVGKIIKEQNIFVLADFTVNDAYGKLRPVFSKYGITFSKSTTVTECMQNDYMIPLYKFEFVDLEDLDQYVNETHKGQKEVLPEFAIDIIGAVEEPELVTKVTTSIGLRDKFIFKVTDGRKANKVTVWGEDGIKLHEKIQNEKVKPVIIIMTGTKLFKTKEAIYIGLLSSSKIYLNLEDEVVIAMRSRLEELGYKAVESKCESPKDDDVIPIEMLTVKKMNGLGDKEYIKRQVFCRIKVNKIEDQDCWWYNSCNVCPEEVSKLDGKFKCITCSRSMPIARKRYKLCIIAEDDTDACNIILHDTAVKRMVGTTATKLVAEINNGETKSTSLPEKIKNIIGKEYTLSIDINEDNIMSDSDIYYASDICDFKSTNEVFNSNFSKNECPSSSLTESSETTLETSTPGTAKSSNKSGLISKVINEIKEIPHEVLNKKIKQEKVD